MSFVRLLNIVLDNNSIDAIQVIDEKENTKKLIVYNNKSEQFICDLYYSENIIKSVEKDIFSWPNKLNNIDQQWGDKKDICSFGGLFILWTEIERVNYNTEKKEYNISIEYEFEEKTYKNTFSVTSDNAKITHPNMTEMEILDWFCEGINNAEKK
jgi:hypothetical protein